MHDWNEIFATIPVLETERCLLRPITPNDKENMFRLYSSPDVNRYLGRLPMTTLEEAGERVNVVLDRQRDQNGITWMVHLDGEFIGNVVIFSLEKTHMRAEIGYSILPAWWGKGIVTEIMTTVVHYAFTRMGLHSLEAKIDPENTGSRRVLEKLGFTQEGYFRESFYDVMTDRFVDTAVFSRVVSDGK